MIRLEVEGYCDQCLDFTPNATLPVKAYGIDFDGKDDILLTDTIVRCEYRKRCAGIARYLEKRLKEGGE